MCSSTVNSTAVNNKTSSSQLFNRSEGLVFCIASIIELLTITIGNAIVIVVFTRSKQLRKRKFYLLINLAIADFLVGAIVLPWWVTELGWFSLLRKHKFNILSTTIMKNTFQFLTFASLINLMMISLERMYATLWPLKHRVLETKTYYVLIGLSWFLPILQFSVQIAMDLKLITSTLSLLVWLSLMCLPLLIICVSYVSIWVKMKFGRHPQHHVTTAQDRKLTVSLLLVTAVSLVTWLPFSALHLALFRFQVLSLTCFIRKILFSLVMLLLVNSLVNPIIYSFRMPQFRQAVLRLVCRRATKRRVQAIEMRNVAEVINRQACALISHHPDSNMATDEQLVERLIQDWRYP